MGIINHFNQFNQINMDYLNQAKIEDNDEETMPLVISIDSRLNISSLLKVKTFKSLGSKIKSLPSKAYQKCVVQLNELSHDCREQEIYGNRYEELTEESVKEPKSI